MSALSIFICNPEASYIAQLCADSDRAYLEHERDEDRDHEEQFAHDAVADGEVDAWPWYADAPIEVVDPEQIDDTDLFGLPVEGGDEDFDDELTVEAWDAERDS